jgi:hypothetical protein
MQLIVAQGGGSGMDRLYLHGFNVAYRCPIAGVTNAVLLTSKYRPT